MSAPTVNVFLSTVTVVALVCATVLVSQGHPAEQAWNLAFVGVAAIAGIAVPGAVRKAEPEVVVVPPHADVKGGDGFTPLT